MKKIFLGVAVLIATAFFVPINNISADSIGDSNNNNLLKQKVDERNSKKNKTSDKPIIGPKKPTDEDHKVKNRLGSNVKNSLNQEVNEKPLIKQDNSLDKLSKELIISKLNESNPDMDWVDANLVQNMHMYHENGSLTDFSLGAAHVATDMLTALNLNIVYPLFEKALSVMFDLSAISDGMNNIFLSVQDFSKTSFASSAFKGLVYVFFGVGLVWVYIKNNHSLKSILIILLIFVAGSAWISSGGTVLEKVNNLTSTAQAQVFKATTVQNGGYVDSGTDFQNAIRRQYFSRTVERPFSLGNFGKVSLSEIETANKNKAELGDPYELIGGKYSSGDISDFNKYISKKGGYEWYQAAIALMSAPMSIAYGLPLLMIALANMLVQLGAILLYYLAPFALMMSLLPKYANSFLKTVLSAIGLLFAKVGLLFGVMFISWVGNISDSIVKPVDSASSMLNSVLYLFLMYLLWKNKRWLVETVTGSSVANSALNKISLTRTGRKMLNTAGQMNRDVQGVYRGARNTLKKGKQWHEDYKNKHSNEFDDNELRQEIQDEKNTKRRQARKGYLAKYDKQLRESIKQQRADRLNKAGGKQKEKNQPILNEKPQLPQYKRSLILKSPVKHSNQENVPKLPVNGRSKHFKVNDEDIKKARERRNKARSKSLKNKEPLNLNKKLSETQEKRKQRFANLDEEL